MIRDDGDGTQSVDVKAEPWLEGGDSGDRLVQELKVQIDDYMAPQTGSSDAVAVKEPPASDEQSTAAPSSGFSNNALGHDVVKHALNRLGTDDINAAAKAVELNDSGGLCRVMIGIDRDRRFCGLHPKP